MQRKHPTYSDIFTESVYELRPTFYEKNIKPPRYVSKHAEQSRKESTASKYATRTFGIPELPRSMPSQFLRKRAKLKPVRLVTARNLPPNVTAKIDPWTYIRPHPLSRDLVSKSRQETLTLQPKCPIPRCVDRHNGDRYVLKNSGLIPRFKHKPAYGKYPKYLIDRHMEAVNFKHSEDVRGKDYLTSSDKRFVKIKDEERQAVLANLKHNFDEALHQFQALSFALDNQTKMKTKTNLEKDLDELEKMIDLVSRRNNIVVRVD